LVGGESAGIVGRPGRGRRIGVLLVAAVLIALASAPAALGADRIYWGNGGTDTISYANLDGSGGGGELNLSGATPSSPRGIAIDRPAGRIYWANQGNDTISYANLDGSGGGGQLNISGTTPSKPHGLAIDPGAGKIYWANDNNTISWANLDGSGGGQLDITGATPAAPYGAAIDPAAGRIYWANRTTNTISHANLDGSGGGGELNTSGANPNDPHGVVVDHAGGRIYWANLDSTISYANLDGSGGGGQLSHPGAPEFGAVGLAVDPTAGKIYWGNLGGDMISWANLDGSGGGQLNLSGASPSGVRFVALLRAPSGAPAPQIAGGSTPGSVLSCSQPAWASDMLGSFLYLAPDAVTYGWTRNGAEIAGATDTSYTAFGTGNYRCRVTATNQAGPTSLTSAPHRIPKAPETKLVKSKMSTDKARFTFKARGDASGFRCKLKRAHKRTRAKNCRSPKTYKHLLPGRYLFKVRAFGPGGADPTPVEKRLTIP
jgi:DNA-binding beta-propeller fold protein YncE